MLAQLSDDIFGLLFITLFFAFAWWLCRLYELTYEDNIDRLPDWMQIWSKSFGKAQKPPGRFWRWLIGGLPLIANIGYLIPFYSHDTPFLIRLVLDRYPI